MTIFGKRDDEMQISEAELSAMTAEMDMLHKETFPVAQKTLDDVAANISHLRTSGGMARRGFLVGVGGVAVLGAAAACSSSGSTSPASGGSSDTSSSGASSSGTGTGTSKYTGDTKVVALAAALENLAVAAYGLALKNATAKKYGDVPPAIATFAKTAMTQHSEHASGWNSVLSKAGLPTITTPAVSIAADQVRQLQGQTSITGVAKQALALEESAAQTYLFAVKNVKDAAGVAVAATIAPVETMHAAILNFVLGQYPVPDSFLGTSMAVMPSALTA